MLQRLTIQNYALIDSLDIEFPDGLVIITGETGAGKSILLGAISLLLGKKVSTSVFSDDTRNCVVEAEFDNNIILRRVVSPTGRSRSFLNDEPVSLSELTDISAKIIDIHEQHQHLLLSDKDFQLSVLDYFSQSTELLHQYQQLFAQYEKSLAALRKLENEIALSSSDADYRAFQFKQLDEAKLRDGELEELEELQKQLSNAEEIKTSVMETLSLFHPMDISLVHNLKEASNLVAKYADIIPGMDDISQRIDSCRIELADIEQELDKTAEGITISPEKLQETDDRLSQLYSLLRKHNCKSVSELIEIRNSLDASLQENDHREDRLESLKKEVEALDKECHLMADKLSERRKEAAPALSQNLQDSIRSLEMPYSEFIVQLTPKEHLTSSGGDDLSFLFSANGEGKLGDISKVASGGELSRVMLSLKELMARYMSLPTMIFDEIDTGVSGKIADRMGDMIGEMGHHMQIFAITHLPQIAAKKGTHFMVYKEFDKNKHPQTMIRRLSYDERVTELARMLSGSSLSDAAIANARVLLDENNK